MTSSSPLFAIAACLLLSGCVVQPLFVDVTSGGTVELSWAEPQGCTGGSAQTTCTPSDSCAIDLYEGSIVTIEAEPDEGWVVDRISCDNDQSTGQSSLTFELDDTVECVVSFLEATCDNIDLSGVWRESYTCESPDGACVEERVSTRFDCEHAGGATFDCTYQETGAVYVGDLVDCVYTWSYDDGPLAVGYDETGAWTFRDGEGAPTPNAFVKRSDCWVDLEDQVSPPLWGCTGYGSRGESSTPQPAMTCDEFEP